MVIDVGGGTRTYRRAEIVQIAETVGQLTGLFTNAVGAGFTLAKSNDYRQLNVDASISYQTTSYRISATVNSIFSRQSGADDTTSASTCSSVATHSRTEPPASRSISG